MRNCYNLAFGPLYVTCLFLLAVKIFSLSLIFGSLKTQCLAMFLFMFIVLEFHCASWICEFIVIKFGKILAIITSDIFHILTFFFSPLWIPNIYIRQVKAVIIPHFTDVVLIFLLILSPSVLQFCIVFISASSKLSTLFFCNV